MWIKCISFLILQKISCMYVSIINHFFPFNKLNFIVKKNFIFHLVITIKK